MTEFHRAGLLNNPTPLERLNRLSDHFGIDLWVKRDDLAGVSYGGNKTRQLDCYFGAALAEDADTILITGAVQSNFTRLAAATAAKLGMRAIVQLEHRVADPSDLYLNSGNVLLSRLLGAEIMEYPVGEDENGADQALYERAEQIKTEGGRPYVIPLGKIENPIGALGYAQAASEIIDQDSGFDFVITGSGSGMTHSGLIAGFAHSDTNVIGSCVRRERGLQIPRITKLLSAYQEMTGQDLGLKDNDIDIWDGALAPGYGKMGAAAEEAMTLMARFEGLILDPVYTSKSFAAVPALVRTGKIPKGARVCFVHTGGLGAFFAYQDQLSIKV